MKMFEELVRVQAMEEEVVRKEFSVNKTKVLRVLKTCAFRELQQEKEAEEEREKEKEKEKKKQTERMRR